MLRLSLSAEYFTLTASIAYSFADSKRGPRPAWLKDLPRMMNYLHFLVLAAVTLATLPPSAHAQIPELIPISAAVADLDGDHVPDMLGQQVRITGTITSATMPFYGFGFLNFLQGDAGLVLFAPDSTLLNGLEPGHRVTATGIVGQYRGQQQIQVTSLERLVQRAQPVVLDLDIAALGEEFSGRLVHVVGILRLNQDDGIITGSVADATGTIPVYIAPQLLSDPQRLSAILQSDGRRVHVRGILLQDTDVDRPTEGFYLLPRTNADLVLPMILPVLEIIAAAIVIVLIGVVVNLGRRRRGAEREAAMHSAVASQLQHSQGMLTEAEARMRHLTATSPTIIYACSVRDRNTTTTWISESVTRMLGYSVEEAVGPTWWYDCLHPDDQANALHTFLEFLAGEMPGSELSHEYRFRHKDGTYRWFRNDLRIVSREGKSVDAVGASLDITAQKEVTIALTLAEARYRRLVETSPDGIFAVDLDGRFFEINPTVAEIFGRDPADVIGRTSREVVAPESQGAIRAEVARLAADPSARADYEAWIIRPTGERRLVHVRSTPIVNDGQVEGAHGVVRDITDARRSETRVQLLGAAVESLGHGVAVSDVGGALVYANSEFANILAFDLDPDSLPSLNDFLPDDTAKEQMSQIDETLRTQGRWSGRIWRRRTADGRVVPLDAVIGTVPSPRGGPPHALTICHEATEAIQRDQQLRRAERLSSLGTLVGGVAHELNNPLNAIINFAALLLTQTRDDEEREDLETIVREGERAAKIVAGLRAIARQADIDQSPKEPVDVNDVVTHVLKLRSYTLSTSNIAVETRLAENLPFIWADRGQVEQVVLNLVINAEQAMAAYHAEGRLRVGTTLGRLGVLLEVTDDGPGIESSNIERIFDPFWTTKAPGEGTGLGLSLVHNIVEEHGGVIDLRSEVGVGTTFYVDMPAAESSTAPEPGDTAPASSSPSLRILVVDDEAAVRRSLVRYLEREGHHVDQAAEGGEALRKVSLSVGYDVILSDLRMPGIDGEQLLLKLKERGRGDERKVVFMTGDATGIDPCIIGTTSPLLIKPVKLSDVGAAIRQKAGEIPSSKLAQPLVA